MRIFGSDRMDGVLQKLGLQEGEAITHPWINKALEKAQQKVEARNFDARKYVLKYDDVMNDQRKVIFEHRIDIMGREDVSDTVSDMRQQVVHELVAECIPPNAYAEQWNTTELKDEIGRIFGLDLPVRNGPKKKASPRKALPRGSWKIEEKLDKLAWRSARESWANTTVPRRSWRRSKTTAR